VRLWDLANRTMRMVLEGHTGEKSQSGCAAGGPGPSPHQMIRTLKCADLEDRGGAAHLAGHTDRVRGGGGGAAGDGAISASDDKTLKGVGTWRAGRSCAPWRAIRIGSAQWRVTPDGGEPSPHQMIRR